MLKKIVDVIIRGEAGHAETVMGPVVAAVGAVVLAIGAASEDMGWLVIVGGIVLALGLFVTPLVNHGSIEKGMYGRLDELEKK